MHMLMLFSEITSFEYVFLLLVLAYIELINIDTKNLKKNQFINLEKINTAIHSEEAKETTSYKT